MKLPFTIKTLQDWGGPNVFRDARLLVEHGQVLDAAYDPPFIRGTISWGTRSIRTSARILADGSCDNQCPCRDNVERGIICSHVIALGMALVVRNTDPELDRKLKEEERHAAAVKQREEAHEFFTCVRPGTSGAVHCGVELALEPDWRERLAAANLTPVAIRLVRGAERRPVADFPRSVPLAVSQADEDLLFVLEEIAAKKLPDRLEMRPGDFMNILGLLRGRAILAPDGHPLAVDTAPAECTLRVDLDHDTGELLLDLRTALPGLREGERPAYWLAGHAGWVHGGGLFRPLAKVLPEPYWEIYRRRVTIPRPMVPRFLREELPRLRTLIRVEAELEADVFSFEPEPPKFCLRLKGSPASLAPSLAALYGDLELPAGRPAVKGSFAHPDPDDLLRYTVRNLPAEFQARDSLAAFGLRAAPGDDLPAVVGVRDVTNFIARAVPHLRRQGWRIEFEGRIAPLADSAVYATPVVHIDPVPGGDGWFEVRFDYDANGIGLTPAEIQRALLVGDSYVEKDGRPVLLDGEAIHALQSVFGDCSSGPGRRPGSFRLAPVYSAYVASTLRALDGVDIEAPPDWLREADRANRRLAPGADADEPLEARFDKLLRPYQKDGVRWLRFLQRNRFGGILADEMGLGKTLQTLVWLSMLLKQRRKAGAGNGNAAAAPASNTALIVCPTSLVENWADEAARFTPNLRLCIMTGADRHARWDDLPSCDLAITSYALLRRDIDRYENYEFAAAVLDEAQHIKNRSTQNSLAARRVRAAHRLVLTGTPIENGVSDLWSIMDFLMPGYLGDHTLFRSTIEQPIQQGGPEGELAQWRLHRKLQPFLLRRLKRDVAKELPPKIERIAACPLSNDQKKVYAALLEESQRKIISLVSGQGFQKSKFEIFQTLLRLRQVCCHLDLLKLKDLKSNEPSAKMDLFFELLDEAVDGGHRVLVFSQFVSMLTILREALDRRNLRHCYLDGSTQNRLDIVRQFNQDSSIPVFLISLKAGGTGLNLTGADMVIHYDPWWNPAVENQATDRAYRIGQKRTVYSVKLIAQDTVEERVLDLQRRKQRLYDATLDASTGPLTLPEMTWQDVQELLNL